MQKTIRVVGILVLGIFAATFLSGVTFAAGTNQYNKGTASTEGLCHGAFANTNGDFAWVSNQPSYGYPNTNSPLQPGSGQGGIGLTGNLNSAAGSC